MKVIIESNGHIRKHEVALFGSCKIPHWYQYLLEGVALMKGGQSMRQKWASLVSIFHHWHQCASTEHRLTAIHHDAPFNVARPSHFSLSAVDGGKKLVLHWGCLLLQGCSHSYFAIHREGETLPRQSSSYSVIKARETGKEICKHETGHGIKCNFHPKGIGKKVFFWKG